MQEIAYWHVTVTNNGAFLLNELTPFASAEDLDAFLSKTIGAHDVYEDGIGKLRGREYQRARLPFRHLRLKYLLSL